MLTIRQGHSEVRTRLPVLRMAVLITSMVTAVASIRMAVMKEEEWEDEVDWVLSQVAWRRMNGTIGMMFDSSSSSNEEEWEQDSVGMDITAILAHRHVLVVGMVLVRGGVVVVVVVAAIHSRQIFDDNNKSNNQE